MRSTFLSDLRIAVRQLPKSKAFTITAILALALGIGANTAIFTLVHAVMLKSLPVADPQRLIRLGYGLQLKTHRWEMSPLQVNNLYSAFFQSGKQFPSHAVQFDCALMMRAIPHEWHEISDVPELAGAIQK